jgi:hypothetical protein
MYKFHSGSVSPGGDRILVFPSNLAARHTRSHSKVAIDRFKASYALTTGFQGEAYAIPIKNEKLAILPIADIAWGVAAFISFAKNNPDCEFYVMRFADDCKQLTDSRCAPLFRGAPDNCVFSEHWKSYLVQ